MTTDAARREATDQWTIDLREQQLRDLRAQLAERTIVVEQLQMALHVRDAQLATATQRAEAAEAALRRSTNVAPGKETCVLMTLDKWTEWHMRLAATTKRAEDAEAVLAAIPMAPLLRIVEALLMHSQPLQFDMDAAERWLQADGRKVPNPTEIREKFGHHFDAIEDVDEWVRQQRRGE